MLAMNIIFVAVMKYYEQQPLTERSLFCLRLPEGASLMVGTSVLPSEAEA